LRGSARLLLLFREEVARGEGKGYSSVYLSPTLREVGGRGRKGEESDQRLLALSQSLFAEGEGREEGNFARRGLSHPHMKGGKKSPFTFERGKRGRGGGEGLYSPFRCLPL